MKQTYFACYQKIISSRGTYLLLLSLFGCVPEVKLGPQTRACAVMFVYVVVVETVYNYTILLQLLLMLIAQCESLSLPLNAGGRGVIAKSPDL